MFELEDVNQKIRHNARTNNRHNDFQSARYDGQRVVDGAEQNDLRGNKRQNGKGTLL